DEEATRAGHRDEYAEAATLHEEAAGLYEDAGLPGHATLARACALLAAAQAPAPDGADDKGETRDTAHDDAGDARGAAADANAGGRGDAPATPADRRSDGEAAARTAALTAAHASLVRLHEETSPLAPHQEARLLRLRATALGLRLQTSRDEEHTAPVLAEIDLPHAFATRHDIVTQIAGARLLKATTHAMTGELPAALTET